MVRSTTGRIATRSIAGVASMVFVAGMGSVAIADAPTQAKAAEPIASSSIDVDAPGVPSVSSDELTEAPLENEVVDTPAGTPLGVESDGVEGSAADSGSEPDESVHGNSTAESDPAPGSGASRSAAAMTAQSDGPLVRWSARDVNGVLVGGATFRIEGPRTSTIRRGNESNVRWSYGADVRDCTSAPCAGLDLDPAPGQFLVRDVTAQHSIQADRRYRVRATEAPEGYFFSGLTDFVETSGDGNTASAWPASAIYNFGSFDLTQFTDLSCAPGFFYSVQDNGNVLQISADGTTSGVIGNSSRSSVNSLGIGANGSVMYAITRAGDVSRDVGSVLRYEPGDAGWTQIPNSAFTTGGNRSIVAGAVNLLNGRFLFGGFHNGTNNLHFRLYEYNPESTGQGAFRVVGTFNTGLEPGSSANGDMAFDLLGNLYIVRSGTTTSIYTVTAEALANASGGTLPFNETERTTLQNISSVNGISFGADGSVILANSGTARGFDPTTWEDLGLVASGLGGNSTDLAGCQSPPTLTLKKDVVDRHLDSDQFRLSVSRSGDLVSAVTTQGVANGIQDRQVGPIPVMVDRAYVIAEEMVPGNAANYASSYVCTIPGGEVIASGDGISGQVTIPNILGIAVDCTFTNAPFGSLEIEKELGDLTGLDLGGVTFDGTYTCVLGASVVSQGTWSVNGAGTADIATTEGAPANRLPIGAVCYANENDLAQDDLPNGSYRWAEPVYGDDVVIATNETRTLTVTNSVERVYGDFQVQKIVPEGSVVDADLRFDGDWICTLDGETITGTWGPIAPGETWSAMDADQIPLGAVCSATENRTGEPTDDGAYEWDGDPEISDPVISGSDSPETITVTNRTKQVPGSVVWSKVDASDNRLVGSEWTLSGPADFNGGQPAEVVDCAEPSDDLCVALDQDGRGGEFRLTGLPWGGYILKETKAPAGYVLISDEFSFTIDRDGWVDVRIDDIVNVPREAPALPLTGGLGRDFFAFLGGAVLAAGLGTLFVARKRNLREVS